MTATILIALGSNRRHGLHGSPTAVVAAAVAALDAVGLRVIGRSRVRATPPLGPRQRTFANALVAVRSDLPLAAVLGMLKHIERDFGRKRGRRWGPRVLDLDIIAAGGTIVDDPGLTVPHPGLAHRGFVLDPLVEVAPDWRHPVLHLTSRQLRARLRRPKPSADTDP